MSTAQVLVPMNSLTPISEFGKSGASKQFAKVRDGAPVTVLKNSKPEYVILSSKDYEQLINITASYERLIEAENERAREDVHNHNYVKSFNADDTQGLRGYFESLQD